MKYVVDIDELVLHGFDAVDRRHLSAGLSEELGRLLVREGLPADAGSRDRLQAQGIEVGRGDDRATGRNLARSLHAGMRG